MRRIVVLPFVVLLAVWSLSPIYWVLTLSLRQTVDLYSIPASLIPRNPTLTNYLGALGMLKADTPGLGPAWFLIPGFLEGLKNSLIIATVVMFLTVVICVPVAYSFARFSFAFRTAIFALILLARSVPTISAAIPYYQFYRSVSLLGTMQGIILADLTLTIPLTTWVLSGFISALPVELDRQARVDGCSRFQMLRHILIPVAAPGVAAVTILRFP